MAPDQTPSKVIVSNVDPTVVVTGPGNVSESQDLVTYEFDTTDPGVADTFTHGTPDCGTGRWSGRWTSTLLPVTGPSTAASPTTT